MKRKSWKCSVVWAGVAALAVCFCAPLGAEKKKSKPAPEALLFGTVFQENGFLVRGARVVVTGVDNPKIRKEAASDIQGEFAVRVPAGKGRYTVEVKADGFSPETKTVEVSGDERVDLTFHLAPLARQAAGSKP
jgi:hypothetical protein